MASVCYNPILKLEKRNIRKLLQAYADIRSGDSALHKKHCHIMLVRACCNPVTWDRGWVGISAVELALVIAL